MKTKDLSDRRFGKLTVLHRVENSRHGKAQWLCRCDCGTQKSTLAAVLIRGEAKSCGCTRAGLARERFTKHGQRGTRTYRIWVAMKTRCQNPARADFPWYGGKGIAVCDRWQKFKPFFADMGECPSADHSIDRIDNSKGYSPDNCRWATAKEQVTNSSIPRMLTHDGRTMCLSDWARELGIHGSSLHERLKKWPIELALSTGKVTRWNSPFKTSH